MCHVTRGIVSMRKEVLIVLKQRIPYTGLVKVELLILLHFKKSSLFSWTLILTNWLNSPICFDLYPSYNNSLQ